MGKQVQFSVETTSAASPAAVYALLGDGATWPSWSPIGAFELGTLITWHEQFETTIPGSSWYLTRALRKFVQACANGLAARAAGQPAAGQPAAG